MIDFTKTELVGVDSRALLANPLITPIGSYNAYTGEDIPGKVEAKYWNMKFIIIDGGRRIFLQGSLHKYANEGLYNFNDFSLEKLRWVLSDLDSKFSLNLLNQPLRNLEFGVNITPPVETKRILNGLLLHRTEPFKHKSIPGGNCKEADHQRHSFKVYDKRKHGHRIFQFHKNKPEELNKEILRIESKYCRMKDLNNHGIYTFGDLLKPCTLIFLYDLLAAHWESVLLYDPTIRTKELKPYVQNTKRHQWKNASDWVELRKQARHKQKKQYMEVVSNHSMQVHKLIGQAIQSKWFGLMNDIYLNQNVTLKKGYQLTSNKTA